MRASFAHCFLGVGLAFALIIA